jgi:hypothetical protein
VLPFLLDSRGATQFATWAGMAREAQKQAVRMDLGRPVTGPNPDLGRPVRPNRRGGAGRLGLPPSRRKKGRGLRLGVALPVNVVRRGPGVWSARSLMRRIRTESRRPSRHAVASAGRRPRMCGGCAQSIQRPSRWGGQRRHGVNGAAWPTVGRPAHGDQSSVKSATDTPEKTPSPRRKNHYFFIFDEEYSKIGRSCTRRSSRAC